MKANTKWLEIQNILFQDFCNANTSEEQVQAYQCHGGTTQQSNTLFFRISQNFRNICVGGVFTKCTNKAAYLIVGDFIGASVEKLESLLII